jgi:catechol 2,3-dioxygenase-like lactoylglutathione lyase family enzyme
METDLDNPRVRATGLNHVSVHATDLAASVRFYEEVLGMQRIPTPRFAFPVQWLRLGDLQFHVFLREGDVPAPVFHHIGINVDDFERAYQTALELGIHDAEAFFSHVYELPDGSVQMYIRDPAGNLLELDWPDVGTLDRSVLPDIKKLGDDVEQDAEALRSTLYLDRLADGGASCGARPAARG